VEFPNVSHRIPGYTFQNFNNMFFSTNIYVTPNMYSPDGKQVHGSLRDYYDIISDGNLNITGYVLNRDGNTDQIPDWLVLPLRKGQYDSTCLGCIETFYNDAIAAANAAGLDVSTNTTTKLAIIYAGHAYRGGGLNPVAFGNTYVMGERFAAGGPYRQERPDAVFSEIGINAHEFGHLLGLPHSEAGRWCLMNGGEYLGPDVRGACPAALNPQLRFLKGWINFTPITSNQTFQADYDLRDPEVFQIRNSVNPDYYWLVETRRFNATMTIGSWTIGDYNSFYGIYWPTFPTQGLLVWRIPFSTHRGRLLHADGQERNYHPSVFPTDPFPDFANVRVVSPWSDSRDPSLYPWVPNTKPSLNVGIEIGNEGVGYYSVDFYYSTPENASPSKPQGLQISASSGHPRLNWSLNQESDVNPNGNYLIHRRIKRPAWQPWILLATVSGSTSQYLDESLGGAPNGIDSVQYKIRARDTQLKLSVFSDSVTTRFNTMIERPVFVEKTGKVPDIFELSQNIPNPFNPLTIIDYQLPVSAHVVIDVYDVLGREILKLVDDQEPAGYYQVTFDGSQLSSGVYFYKMVAGEFIAVKKLVLMK